MLHGTRIKIIEFSCLLLFSTVRVRKYTFQLPSCQQKWCNVSKGLYGKSKGESSLGVYTARTVLYTGPTHKHAPQNAGTRTQAYIEGVFLLY